MYAGDFVSILHANGYMQWKVKKVMNVIITYFLFTYDSYRKQFKFKYREKFKLYYLYTMQ